VLTEADRARIEAAVAEAEAGTSGDILCVLAREVSTYREVPLAWGAAIALLAPPIALAFGLDALTGAVGGGWTAGQAAALRPQLTLALSAYAMLQILLFGAVTLLVSWAPIRRRLTPRFLKRHRVRKAAYHHFAAASSHARSGATGVVIFVAFEDRQVEIIADEAIHDAVGEPVWKAAAAAIGQGMRAPDPTAGIVEAIGLCGEALRAHFPGDGMRTGADRPVEL